MQQLPASQVTVAMASLVFDWIFEDLEYTSITIQESEVIFIVAVTNNCKQFVRLTSATIYLARRYLDAGAVYLLMLVVESLKKFYNFGDNYFFLPKGKRGLGLVKDFNSIIIAQIEIKNGALNINNI